MRITFIIPIHNQLHLLRRCVESIWLHTPPTDFSIVLVNDGSTDGRVEEFCQRLVLHGRRVRDVISLRNDTPQGFTAACNQGMAIKSVEDCTHYVFINTDTEIGTPDWTQSLRKLSDENPDVGLFGPISNNATSQSVPTHWGSGLPKGETVSSFTKLISSLTQRRFPPISLVHGFCYIIRRAVIDDIGSLDDETFPHYGSEDDLSLRAAQAGWRGAILDDTFVHHIGRASYTSARRRALVSESKQTLLEKFGEDYITTLSRQGSGGLVYLREAMAEHYGQMRGVPRRVQ